MSNQDNRTAPTTVDPEAWLETVEPTRRREDGFVILDMMKRITGCDPVMWGPSMIGFDKYHYKYESGREGDMFLTGFSPRKANLALYVISGFDGLEDLLSQLGKHKTGKSCLYVNKLDDIDMAVLEKIITRTVEHMRAKYHGA